MFVYTIKRILLMIPVILGVIAIVYFFQGISDVDPALSILGAGSTEEAREELRDELGLNDPVVVQFGRYVWNLFTKGDLGLSYKTRQSISGELLSCFPVTLKMALISVIFGALIGIPLGVWAAVKQYSFSDNFLVAFSVFISSIPQFWFALMLISLFSVKLGWLPTSGIATWKGWILPSVTTIVGAVGANINVTRSSMLETIRQEYVRMARAKGQTEFKIITSHVLRNSLIPILAAVGNGLGMTLGGALITETVFAMPGIGKYAVDGIGARNYPAVLGSVVVLAIAFSIVNLIVDLSFTFVDPKLKTTIAKENRIRLPKKKAAEPQKGEA